MEMEPNIENMTVIEYLEYEAAKERRLWDNDITVKDVERVKQFFTPNVPDVIDNIQPLISKTIHTTPPDEDYATLATKSILDDLLEEFKDEILNVIMVDEGEKCSPTMDLEELERLLAKDPQSHYRRFRPPSGLKGLLHTLNAIVIHTKVDAHRVVLGSFFAIGRHFKFILVKCHAKDDDGIFVIMDEVIESGATLPKTQVMEGVTTVMPTSIEDKAQRRLEVKARSTLMIDIFNEHQLKSNSIKDAKQLLEVIKKRFDLLGKKFSQEDVNLKLLRSLSPEWNTHVVVWRNNADLETMSMDDLYNNLKVYEPKDLEQIHPDDMEEIDLRWQMAMLTIKARRECRAPRNQDTKHKEITKRNVPIKTPTSIALVSCDGLGGYDWSDQAKEGPNYALMTFTSLSFDSKGNPQKDLHDKGVTNSRCSSKNSVLFNDTECIVLSPKFKIIDETYLLLRVPRKNNMYSVHLKSIVPKGGLTCLFAKATSDESKLWHIRLGYLNFKTMNKLVKENLVRGKFDDKADKGFFVRYSLNSKDFRVFNSRTRIAEEKLHIRFSENTPNVVGSGPDWLFDIGALTRTMNYEPIVASTQSNGFEDPKSSQDDGFKPSSDDRKKVDEDPRKENEYNKLPFDPNVPALEDASIFNFSNDDEDDDIVADMNNMDTTIQVSHVLSTRIYKDHPLDQVIEYLHSATQTRNMSKNLRNIGLQVKQKNDGIFISLDKYGAKILKKFRFTEVKNASTPMETQKPGLKDENGKEVDVYMYRSMIDSLMYLTSLRPDNMFVVCACARYQVNLKVSHLYAMKRIFRVAQIHAWVDGKEIIITALSIRRDLRLEDEEGVDCFPNSTIFKNLELMGRRKINNIDVDKDITLVNDQDDAEMSDVNDLHVEEVSAAGEVNVASIAITVSAADKGKGIMVEEPVKHKKKDQIRLDEEAALKLQAELQTEFDEKQRLAREITKKELESNIALIETWDDV
uniref:Putative ribonuclease H-like domain-containing protein n=1 Tax=Tanacetum cinerariifolium TaxID=118510 RepID=A0A699GRF3_TANCI|nr:putative ribonuclease H-like domain-containing protein [Tanacetum cinerariifolium]